MTEKCSHKNDVIRFRVATKDRKIMEAAAKRSEMTLSDWLRRAALLAACGTMSKLEDDADNWTKIGADLSDCPPTRPNQDKILAFQKRAGMGGVKSRG